MTVKQYMHIKPRLRGVFAEAFGFIPTDRQLFNMTMFARRHFSPLAENAGKGGAA